MNFTTVAPPHCKCGETDATMFSPSRRKAGTRCRACSNAKLREWRATDAGAEWSRKYNRDWRAAKHAWVNATKIERGCIVCGFNEFAPALHFHHRDPSVKAEEVSRMLQRNLPEDIILAEIEKCDVYCANHHAILTWGDNNDNPMRGE